LIFVVHFVSTRVIIQKRGRKAIFFKRRTSCF
jgi:hypothetical protein